MRNFALGCAPDGGVIPCNRIDFENVFMCAGLMLPGLPEHDVASEPALAEGAPASVAGGSEFAAALAPVPRRWPLAQECCRPAEEHADAG